jgi:Flp pilus assembly protein TadG
MTIKETIRKRGANRQRARGAAIIEMTLFLPLLMLLVCGMIDYGYYFYVSMTANEAARVAARTASSTSTGVCGSAAVTATATNAKAVLASYMGQIGMGTSTNLTSVVECVPSAGLDPLWHVKVTVDFPPAVGFIKSLMRPSTKTPGWLVYSSADVYALGT